MNFMLSRKRLSLFIAVDAIIKCIIVCLTMQSLEMLIATFRLLTASLFQAIRSTDCLVSFISQRSAVSGAFRSSFCSIVPASSCSLSGLLLLCILIVGIHASGISIPLSLFSAGNNFSSLTGHVSFQIFILVGHLINLTGH